MNRLLVICFLCLCSFVGISQETKIYPEKTVYYKENSKGEMEYINTELYVKELLMFQYNDTYVSLNFYIGEYRYTYFFNYEYSENKGIDEEVQYWRSNVNECLMILEDSTITIYSFKYKFSVVYHIIDN